MVNHSFLFEIIDPRGITIHCSREQWEHHVLRNKPFMKQYLEEVKTAFRNPDFICLDVNHDTRQCYYVRKSGSNLYLKVVVNLENEREANLVTAFLADSGKKGEKVIWPPLKG
jgi:hypothetical protein